MTALPQGVGVGPGERVQWLTVLGALEEDLELVSSTHMAADNHL